jgi:MFS family permease
MKTASLTTLKANLVPPAGLPRRVAMRNLIFGVGSGTFLTGSAVFFTQVVGLQPLQVGLGLSVASAAAFATAVPLSKVADRVGAQRTWTIGTLAAAILFCIWPFAHNFTTFVLLVTAVELTATLQQTGRGVYLIEALDPETRVLTQAFSRSWMNVGWSLGTGMGTIALAIDTRPAYYALVLVNAGFLFLNTFLIWTLPSAGREVSATDDAAPSRSVFRDHNFLAVTAVCAVLLCYGTIFAEVMQLWIIYQTDAPQWWIGVLTLANTVMAITLQVPAAQGAHTIAGAAKALRYSGWAAFAACPIFLLTKGASGWLTVVLLFLAVVLITMSELWQSAGAWTLAAELPPPDRRGEYLGAFRMGGSIQGMVAPVALVALAVTTGGWGWLVIAAMFLLAAIAVNPIVARSVAARPEAALTAEA